MIVSKAVYLNTIEPAWLNFRAPMNMETKLDVTFFNQNGSPYNQDLAAQLQLTSRSQEQTSFYAMPSIDVVNGKARAVIPADFLQDENGYRLRITGTIASEPALLALGTLYPLAAAGPDAVPQDTIDQIDLAFERNAEARLTVKLWDDIGKTDPFDLTTTSISANVYDVRGGTMLMPFTVTVLSANTVELLLTVSQVNILPDQCWWSMSASNAGGLTTLCEGSVTVTGTVIPPLVTTTVSYDYQNRRRRNPVGGQIIHGSAMQNLLRIAKTTAGLADFSATLELVAPGDQIAIDVTTWTVSAAVEKAGWYEFTVTPVAQAAVSGTTTVTFSRPVP
jgi:hypothetical protein